MLSAFYPIADIGADIGNVRVVPLADLRGPVNGSIGRCPQAPARRQQATHAIPIVFVVTIDPVGQGLVASVARPGGNIAGFTSFEFPIVRKWLEMLKEIVPGVSRTRVMFSPPGAPWLPLFMREFGVAQVLTRIVGN